MEETILADHPIGGNSKIHNFREGEGNSECLHQSIWGNWINECENGDLQKVTKARLVPKRHRPEQYVPKLNSINAVSLTNFKK